ncbi:PTS sugar transporter subunit IIA [Halofilum ochraceum]|uniref:PTS sugar transporter subunit IIA n=1 Tax=Halofilum ochraceum TaxID=1611323 RepID=UPI0009F4E37C|nr:PTS sugar transporter subunit IIA [Halofilum ochraceum]
MPHPTPMSVALVTITHNGIGKAIVDAAESILGSQAMDVHHCSFNAGDDVERFEGEVMDTVGKADDGDGVLVLTDLIGATPCNVAQRLAPKHHVRVLSGISLPMVLRVFTYARCDLAQLIERAGDGAHVGVIECGPPDQAPL